MLKTFNKQTGDRLDFDFDYTKFLAARGDDTIESATIVAESGLTIDSSLIVDNRLVKFFCSGGTDQQKYKVTCIAQTVGGRVIEAECYVAIQDT